jgi:thiol-disulfide isomerase/thioredoxin
MTARALPSNIVHNAAGRDCFKASKKRVPRCALLVPTLLGAMFLQAQVQGDFGPQALAAEAARQEQDALNKALSEGASSSVDLIRVLEAHLKKYPGSSHQTELVNMLAKAAIDTKDDARIIQYGERVLATTPDDVLMLDRAANALLDIGGKEHAEQALRYARKFEDIVDALPQAIGKDAPQKQEDRDRARARALIYQSRARVALGETEDAERVASRAYETYPNAECAREWANVLLLLGRTDDAMQRLADAFAIPDMRALETDRQTERLKLGELYSKKNGSEKGLGDFILAAYDRTSSLVELHRKKNLALDPNSAAQNLLEFTITALDGRKLQLKTFEGKVVVLDFWATWCEPCRIQHPMYEEVKKIYANRDDVVFLDLSADEDRDAVPDFLLKEKWDRKIYFEDGLARLLQVVGIPTTVLFNKQGRVASRMNGFLPDTFVAQLRERIDEALRE